MKRSERVRASASRRASRGACTGASRSASRGVWKLTENNMRNSEKVRKGMKRSEKV